MSASWNRAYTVKLVDRCGWGGVDYYLGHSIAKIIIQLVHWVVFAWEKLIFPS